MGSNPIPGTIFHFFACLAIVGGLSYTLRVRNEGAVIEGLANLLEGLLIVAAGVNLSLDAVPGMADDLQSDFK